ncbi:hypothetical protein U1Q18_017606, partial [Sarracenia purpurea var. burkii]
FDFLPNQPLLHIATMVKKRPMKNTEAAGISNPGVTKKARTGPKKVTSLDKKDIISGRAINLGFFEREDFAFPSFLKTLKWDTLLKFTGPSYPDLVRSFYANRLTPSVLRTITFPTEVKGIKIDLHPRLLNEILNIPEGDICLEYNAKKFEYDGFVYNDFIKEICEIEPQNFLKFESSILKLEMRLLHHFVNHIFASRKGNYGEVNQFLIYLMWCIAKTKNLNLGYLYISHMIHVRDRGNAALVHGMFLTKVFQSYNLDLSREKSVSFKDTDLYGISTLHRMHFIKNSDGVWVKDPKHYSLKKPAIPPIPATSQPQPSHVEAPISPVSQSDPPSHPSKDIPSSSTPVHDIPPTQEPAIPSSSSAPPSIDLSLILNKLEAMEASQSAFQAKVYNDLHLLKQAESWKTIGLNNIQVFLQSHFGQQQLGPQFRPFPFPKVPHRPQGEHFQPPQSSQAHSTPVVRPHEQPPQGVPISPLGHVSQAPAAPFPPATKDQGTAAPIPAIQPAILVPAASAPVPVATQVQSFVVQSQPAAAQAHSSSSTAKKKPSTQDQQGSSKVQESASSAREAQMRKEVEDKVQNLLTAAKIKPIPPSLEPPPPKPSAPASPTPEKHPSPSNQDSDVEILSPPHPEVHYPIPLQAIPADPPAEPKVFVPVVWPPVSSKDSP